ncbi:MAG: tyrosine-type recombinase/integrase [Bacillus sp. (in: Bacteria)]|nr:tyrosine-type recombinase/integrase [Bacillus sp. (in: firmicutes)]
MGLFSVEGENKKERVIPIGVTAKLALKEYLEKGRPKLLKEGHNFLFVNRHGAMLSRQGFWKVLKQIAKEADIHKTITPQVIRNSFAAHMLENGADVRIVSELLGHANLMNTLVYLQQPKVRLKETYSKFHPRA